MESPSMAIGCFDVKIASAFLAFTGILAPLLRQGRQAPSSAGPSKCFSHHQSGELPPRRRHDHDQFQGTELMQGASGEAKVQNKGNRN